VALPPICGGEHVEKSAGTAEPKRPQRKASRVCALDPNALDSGSATFTELLKSVVRWRKLVPHLGY